jgi:hypothetical protein
MTAARPKSSRRHHGANSKGLTLADLAADKGLPVEHLTALGLKGTQWGVTICYYDAAGGLMAAKGRTSPRAKDGSFWPKGLPLAAYGIWKLAEAVKAGFLVIAEGESDCWTLWHYGIPALGLPGSGTAKALEAEQVANVAKIYVVNEKDAEGPRFVVGVADRLQQLGFKGQVFELRMPDPYKDPNELHVDEPRNFVNAFQAAVVAAKPVRLVAPANGHTDHNGAHSSPRAKEWDRPHPLGTLAQGPAFTSTMYHPWLGDWVRAEAVATQTPEDMAGMLVLSMVGAGLAKKVRVLVRPGWSEPTNLFTVVALPPGERKSAVFGDALYPVQQYEVELQEMMKPVIAQEEAEHRMLEARLKEKERKVARCEDDAERAELQKEAKDLAMQLAAHQVSEPPQLFCDDVTPEALGKLLSEQGGRMLQAAAEGTCFEICKGRYSETANFDVYLKGHAGDPLRVNRVNRGKESVNNPALSMALAVQPDVLRGLADQSSMRGRGFLARFLYSVPHSKMGARHGRPDPVSGPVRQRLLRRHDAGVEAGGGQGRQGPALPAPAAVLPRGRRPAAGIHQLAGTPAQAGRALEPARRLAAEVGRRPRPRQRDPARRRGHRRTAPARKVRHRRHGGEGHHLRPGLPAAARPGRLRADAGGRADGGRQAGGGVVR